MNHGSILLALLSFLAGVFTAILLELRAEEDQISSGYIEHKGKIYWLVPASPTGAAAAYPTLNICGDVRISDRLDPKPEMGCVKG